MEKDKKDLDPKVQAIVDLALEKKAEKLILLEVGETCSYADYFMVCSGRSSRQVQSISSHIERQMKTQHKTRPMGVEGQAQGHWVLMDYDDIIVHIFYAPVREFYDLEGVWPDAPRTEFND